MDEFSQRFEREIPALRAYLMRNLESFRSQVGFRSVWEDFEDRIIHDTQEFLYMIFPDMETQDLIRATSKSVFPELKAIYMGSMYAIDVKSGEDVMDPWYDMGRLDTFEEKHLELYKNEYYITVKWHKESNGITIVELYIEPFFKTVGLHSGSGGVKYRPYDGKLRPKSWGDFASGRAYWNTIDEFREGLKKSRTHRRMQMVADWYRKMSVGEREALWTRLNELDDQPSST